MQLLLILRGWKLSSCSIMHSVHKAKEEKKNLLSSLCYKTCRRRRRKKCCSTLGQGKRNQLKERKNICGRFGEGPVCWISYIDKLGIDILCKPSSKSWYARCVFHPKYYKGFTAHEQTCTTSATDESGLNLAKFGIVECVNQWKSVEKGISVTFTDYIRLQLGHFVRK